jgi:amino acid adenylation domain-containing protein
MRSFSEHALSVEERCEQMDMVHEWNAIPHGQSVSQVFEMQVQQRPDAIAISYQDEQLTYSELNARANQLAHYLREQSIGSETCVGVYLERSLDMVVALLAILKAGGIYVPLDLSYPQERIAFMVQDARIPLLLAQEHLLARLPHSVFTVRTICIDTVWPAITRCSQENLPCQTNGENLAYVVYTSGSTGKPKGVEVRQQGILRLLFGVDYVKLDEQQTLLQMAPISFDAATFELWGALLHGGRCVLFPAELPTVLELGRVLRNDGVNTLWLTASLFNVVIDEAPHVLAGVRQLLVGGEALSVDHVLRGLASLPDTQIINGYGPTENTTFSCCYPVEGILPAEVASIPIGRPIGNTQAYVVDESGQPVPVGESGELYLGGAGLARGYLNQPSLTAERFVPDWLSGQPGERLYKTGDLVRYLPDGCLDFLGRVDQQVKLRGFRIELGEIEAVLRQHPGTRDVIVLLREDEPGQKHLVAYVVLRVEQRDAVDADELRSWLQERIPAYMLPSSILLLETLPLNSSGKVNRQALLPPEEYQPTKRATYTPPRMPVEEALVNIWCQVLGNKQVGIHDNFFELGGHSLLATRMIARIRDVLGVEIQFRDVFESPTIAELARRIEQITCTAEERQVLPLRPLKREGPIPLSYAQERLWFLDQFTPGNPFYILSYVWHLEGNLEVAALAQSLKMVIQRHDILRTCFIADEGRPMQVVMPDIVIPLSVIDLTSFAAEERERQAESLISMQARTPFDLARTPLLRAYLLRIDEQTHILHLTMHHIITDGWSMDILFRELSAGYHAALKGKAPALATVPFQYADYALWQREWLQGEELARQLSYWQQQLAGAQTLLSLPTDKPRPSVQTFEGGSYRFVLPHELSSALTQLSQQEGVTLFMTLFAGFALLLWRYSRQNDLLIGTPVANRSYEELEGIVGFFVNMLPLRLNLSGHHPFRQLLRRVREVAMEAFAHQDVPFERLVEELRLERGVNHAPLCQVVFALQNTALEPLALTGLCLAPREVENEAVQFDLILEMTQSERGLEGKLQYSRELFEADTIERFAEHYQRLLSAVVAQPQETIGRLPLLTEAERRVLVGEWNATEQVYPNWQSVVELVEEQAKRRPEAIAVACAQEHLSYGELNQRANQLARYLREAGVGVEHLVGVCLERGVELVVSLLAILKAGGAYVPLDPAYPVERLAFMLEDAHLSALLTTSAFSHKDVWATGEERRLICLDKEQEHFARQSGENVAIQVLPDNLAYVIYTSGSTGRPKGVQITHRGLHNLIIWHEQAFALTSQDRTSQVASVSFDASGWELWPTLAVGATICLVEDDVRNAPLEICMWLAEQHITCGFLPTPLAESVLDEAWPTGIALRTLLTGGDMLHRAPDHALPFTLVNNYGPTEGTVVSTSGKVIFTQGDTITGTPTIGRPIANTQVYVLDAEMQPVPIGVRGELYIGGEGLARGYLHRAELTAERFVPNPFDSRPGLRLYKTGDMVRYRADGSLDFLGRNDEQVKIRGFRVELGEIEAIVRQHPGVREAAVIAREERQREKRLVTYLVPEPELPLTLSQLRQYLQARLPHYMIPSAFVTLERLPLSPNGKLDRRALPAPTDAHQNLENRYVPPRNSIEEGVASIWVEVLGVERVGVYDNFFEAGGHSLLATQVIARVQHAFQVNLSLRHLFEHPQLAELAQIVARMTEETQPVAPRQVSQPAIGETEEDTEHLLARLDQLSAEEVDALLRSMLSEQKEND